MKKIFENRWTLGNANFGAHHGADPFKDFSGMFTIYSALDKSIGTEVILYIRDETDFIYDVAKQKPFQLFMKTGIVRTHFGPVMFLLFQCS